MSGQVEQVQSDKPDRAYLDDPQSTGKVQTFYGATLNTNVSDDISGFGFPYRTLQFTKTAKAEVATVNLFVNFNGIGAIDISGLTVETIAVKPSLDGENYSANALMVRKTDGTFAAATALGNGLYLIEVR